MNDLPPLVPPRPVEERPVIDWDTPVGNKPGSYGHAHVLSLITR